MVTTEKRISTAQLFTVIFILGMSVKMLMLPVLLLKASGRDAALSMALILVGELVCLGIMIAALVLAPQKSFTELLESCIGKWASRAVYVLFAAFFFSKLVLLSGEIRIFFSENLFTEFSWCVYSLPFIGMCIVIAMGSLRALGRTAQFLFPFVLAATVLIFALVSVGVDYAEILPIAEHGLKNLLPSSYRHAMWYGDYSALVIFFGSLKRTKKTAALSAVAGALSAVTVLFFTVGLTASFADVSDLVRFGQNVTGISHYALGNVMQGRFDLALFCVWLFSAFVKAGIFMYATVYFIRAVYPLNTAATALGVGLAQYVVILAETSATALHTFMMSYFAAPALIFQIFVPAISIVAALSARRKERKRGKDEMRGGQAESSEVCEGKSDET